MAQKMVYQWNKSHLYRKSAQEVGERIESIRRKSEDGTIDKAAIVADGVDVSSPLHPLFEWDDVKAAHGFRLEQARHILKDISVVIEEDGRTSTPIRAFVSLKNDDGSNSSKYESISVVVSSPQKREQLLKQALGELNSWRQRYAELQEFMRLHQAIDKMLLVIGKEATSAAQASA